MVPRTEQLPQRERWRRMETFEYGTPVIFASASTRGVKRRRAARCVRHASRNRQAIALPLDYPQRSLPARDVDSPALAREAQPHFGGWKHLRWRSIAQRPRAPVVDPLAVRTQEIFHFLRPHAR